MSEQAITLEVRDQVARVTLNRPQAANSINLELARALLQALDRCEADSKVRAVVLTGAGAKMFSAGGDLKTFAGLGDDVGAVVREITLYLHAAVSRLARMRAPVIAAVNGAAAGAGMSLALAADIVLAAESASFTMAYTAAGLSPDGSASYFLPRLIGLRRAQELMLTNRRLSAAEAEAWGLVTRVVPDGELMEAAETLATRLARGPTLAYGAVKRLLADGADAPLETQLEREARTITEIAQTQDAREGVRAFAEKRAPKFSGR